MYEEGDKVKKIIKEKYNVNKLKVTHNDEEIIQSLDANS